MPCPRRGEVPGTVLGLVGATHGRISFVVRLPFDLGEGDMDLHHHPEGGRRRDQKDQETEEV
ncbi:MAG TPA: hypothetical protein VN842_01860, partial [Thermoplasmata archaeon]|nr:hypothetical protein [Thermoplasmata archaeon]